MSKLALLDVSGAHAALGDIPLPPQPLQGKKPRSDRQFNRAYDSSGLPLLSLSITRLHGRSLPTLLDRRHKRATAAAEQRLREEGARAYRRGVQEREASRAVRLTLGLRQSWRKWSISAKITCKEDRAERDARTIKQRRRFHIMSFALNCDAYEEGFEEAVGLSEEVTLAGRRGARQRAARGAFRYVRGARQRAARQRAARIGDLHCASDPFTLTRIFLHLVD